MENKEDIFAEIRDQDFDVIRDDEKDKDNYIAKNKRAKKWYAIFIFIFGLFTIVQMNIKELNVNNMIITDIGNFLTQSQGEFKEPELNEIELRNGNVVSSGDKYIKNNVESLDVDYDYIQKMGTINTEVDFLFERLERIIFITNLSSEKDRTQILRTMGEMQANAELFSKSFSTIKQNVIDITASNLIDKSTSIEFIRFVSKLEEFSYELFSIEGEHLIFVLGEKGDERAKLNSLSYDISNYNSLRSALVLDLPNIKINYSYITDMMLEQLL